MAMIFRTFFRLLYLFTNFVNFVLMWSVASLCDLLWLFSVQQHVAGVIRHASSSVLRRCVLYVFSLVSNKIATAVFKFTRHEHYWKWPYLMSLFITKNTAGKYRELTAKKCHHVPKPKVELQRPCILAECPTRTTPPLYRWRTPHHLYPPQPLPQAAPSPEWDSSPWSHVRWHKD